MSLLKQKYKDGGILVFWAGWEGNYIANVVGNYPWFATMNIMQRNIPIPEGAFLKLCRNAFCGAVASSVSDLVSNGIRVVSKKKQTHSNADIGYVAAAKEVIDKDGLQGLLLRGLETKIYTNILQTSFFTVLWKYLQS